MSDLKTPWTVEVDAAFDCIFIRDRDDQIIACLTSRDRVEKDVPEGKLVTMVARPHVLEKASLMCAAPEMRDLIALLAEIQFNGPDDVEKACAMRDVARDILDMIRATS